MDLENSILKSDIQHLGVKSEHAKSLALEKQLEIFTIKNDMHQIETKAKRVQESLETLIDVCIVSESKWEEENTSSLQRIGSWQAAWLVETWSFLHYKNTV